MKWWILLVLGFWSGHFTDAQELHFFKEQKTLTSLTPQRLQQKAPFTSLDHYDPLEKTRKTYKGHRILPLLETLYGPETLAEFDTVVFYSKDGYRADVPLTDLKERNPILATEILGQKDFVLRPSQQKMISLEPYYLVWGHKDLKDAGRKFYRWPYQITRIDLARSQQVKDQLLLTKNRSFDREAQALFIQHCLGCHKLNHVGGELGPALNAVVPLWKKEELSSFLLSPKTFRPSSSMAGLPRDLPQRQQIADKISNFVWENVEHPRKQ